MQDEVKSGGVWALVPGLAKGLELPPTTKSATLGLALLWLIYLQLQSWKFAVKGRDEYSYVSVTLTYIPLTAYYYMYSSHLAS